MNLSRRSLLKCILGTAGLTTLSGCVTTEDVRTLNWTDIERNVPARRCLFGCPDSHLRPNQEGYGAVTPDKHPSNPVIGTSSRSDSQAYPTPVIKVDDTYYGVSKVWPQPVGFTSLDGVEWSEANSKLLPLGGSDEWDSTKISPKVFRYDPESDTYHLYYWGYDGEENALGHATSDEPLRNYEKDENNPILTDSSVDSVDGYNLVTPQVNDVVRIDDEFVFFGSSSDPKRNVGYIWRGTGDDWNDINPQSVLFTEEDDALRRGENNPVRVTEPSVVRVAEKYVMCYAALWKQPEPKYAKNVGKLFMAVGDTPDDIAPNNELLLDTGECDTWEELRVYSARWMKRQDGSYLRPDTSAGAMRLYYSGHDCGASKFFGNRGKTGLAEYDTTEFDML
jgi:hypothetical protein